MMLAQRVHVDVLDDDHVAMVLVEDGIGDYVAHRLRVAAREPGQALRHTERRTPQPCPLRVFPQSHEQLAHEVLERRAAQVWLRLCPSFSDFAHSPLYST